MTQRNLYIFVDNAWPISFFGLKIFKFEYPKFAQFLKLGFRFKNYKKKFSVFGKVCFILEILFFCDI